MAHNRTHYATTWYNHRQIFIFLRTDDYFCQNYHGSTSSLKDGNFEIEINYDLQDTCFWTETLIHEFVHVLEFCNQTKDFNPRIRNGCTAVARTVGAGLGQMLDKMKLISLRIENKRPDTNRKVAKRAARKTAQRKAR